MAKERAENIADLAYERTKPISDEVEAFVEGEDPRIIVEPDPIEANRDSIQKIIETYTKIIKLARKQLEEAWIPLLKGEVNEDVFIDDPRKFTEKDWETKVREIDRVLSENSFDGESSQKAVDFYVGKVMRRLKARSGGKEILKLVKKKIKA